VSVAIHQSGDRGTAGQLLVYGPVPPFPWPGVGHVLAFPGKNGVLDHFGGFGRGDWDPIERAGQKGRDGDRGQ
jgi:hypothetical protein